MEIRITVRCNPKGNTWSIKQPWDFQSNVRKGLLVKFQCKKRSVGEGPYFVEEGVDFVSWFNK